MAYISYAGDNIIKSPFVYKTDLGFQFFFATQIRRDKFIKQHLEFRKTLSNKFLGRYGYHFEMDVFADLVLYSKIETSAFLVNDTNNGEVYSWQNEVKLGTVIKTTRL